MIFRSVFTVTFFALDQKLTCFIVLRVLLGLQAREISRPCLQDPYGYSGFRHPRASKHVKYTHPASKALVIIVVSGA